MDKGNLIYLLVAAAIFIFKTIKDRKKDDRPSDFEPQVSETKYNNEQKQDSDTLENILNKGKSQSRNPMEKPVPPSIIPSQKEHTEVSNSNEVFDSSGIDKSVTDEHTTGLEEISEIDFDLEEAIIATEILNRKEY